MFGYPTCSAVVDVFETVMYTFHVVVYTGYNSLQGWILWMVCSPEVFVVGDDDVMVMSILL